MEHEPGSISHGTLITQELVDTFIAEILDADKRLKYECKLEACWSEEEMEYLLEELFDVLNEEAPEGYYFGAHWGDGSDFGFWPIK